MDTLPREINLQIFSYFSTDELLNLVSSVSRKWRDLAFDPILWKTIWLDGDDQTSKQQIYVLQRGRLVRRLELSCFCKWRLLFDNLLKPEYLRELEIEDCVINKNILTKLVKEFPLIESFHFIAKNYDPQIIHHCVKWQNLKEFRTHYAKPPICGNRIIEFIAESVKNLENFSLGHYSMRVNDGEFAMFIRAFAHSLINLDLFYTGLTDDGYKVLKRCKKLNFLTFFPSRDMTIDGLMTLKKLRNLETIILISRQCLTKSDFCQLFLEPWFRIKRFHFRTCVEFDDECVEKLTRVCPFLKIVEVANCQMVTDKGIEILLCKCSNLETLYVSNLNITGSCFTRISTETSNLLKVEIGRCAKIEQRYLKVAIAENTKLKIACDEEKIHV